MENASGETELDAALGDLMALDTRRRMKLISLQLERMAHALAGEVEPVLVAEFILLANRLDKRIRQHDGPRAA